LSLTYQHVVVHGLPYDRGFSHGQQVQSKIALNVANYKKPGKLPPWLVSYLSTCKIK
jgi:isopenicillin-N N-acyltransferase-like protein